MSSISWGNGNSAAWNSAAAWNGGIAPGAGDSVTIAAQGGFTVSIAGTAACAALTLNAAGALLYTTGTLAVGGTTSLSAGTLALSGGTLTGGGTLALSGGSFAEYGGSLANLTVAGLLDMSAAYSTLYLRQGVGFTGTGGAGNGSILLTGSYANLTAIGSQTLTRASITLGTANGANGAAMLGVADAPGAVSASTLTLGLGMALNQGGGNAILQCGSTAALPGQAAFDSIANLSNITVTGGHMLVAGNGVFANAGSIAISNGATFTLSCGGFTNSGAIAVSNATFALGGTFNATRLSNLGKISFSQGVLLLSGTADNRNATLTLGNGVLPAPLSLGGTIWGGTVIDQGGGVSFAPESGVFNGAIYRGSLTLGDGSAVTLANGASLQSASGGIGTASITGSAAGLFLRGTEILNQATLSLGNAQAASFIATSDPLFASQGASVTLGANMTINQTGARAAILANATSPMAGYGMADSLNNQGVITANIAGGTLTLGGAGIIVNSGTIAVDAGETLAVSVNNFTNTGLLSIGGQSSVTLGQNGGYGSTASSWTNNTGTISLAGGTLVLAGNVATAALGQITIGNGGSAILTGLLQNNGTTLSLGSTGLISALSLAGTIAGGTIADASGALSIASYGNALLNNVTYLGTLNLANSNAALTLSNGFSASAIAITGAGADMIFSGSQTLSATQIMLGGQSGAAILDIAHDYTAMTATTLTIAQQTQITETGMFGAIGAAAGMAGDAIVNLGTITNGQSGAVLSLGGPGFSNQGLISISHGATLAIATNQFSNSGNIALTNATLAISGDINASILGGITLNSSKLAVGGELDCGSATLAIGTGTRLGQIALSGTLHGGTINDAGQGLLCAGGATLDQISYNGTLDLSRPFSQLTFNNGLTLSANGGNGAVLLTGAGDKMIAGTTETLDNATIYAGNAGTFYLRQKFMAPELVASAGTTLTLGKNFAYHTAGLQSGLGDAAIGRWTDTIINNGLIMAATQNGQLAIGASNFINLGGMPVANNCILAINSVNFTNAGNMSLVAGSGMTVLLSNYFASPFSGNAPFTNSGTLHMLGGAFAEVVAGGIFPYVPLINTSTGTIVGVGTINAAFLNNGLIEAEYGPLYLQQAVTGNGTLAITQPSSSGQINMLDCASSVSAGETVDFTGISEVLKLDQAPGFAGSIANFAGSDQIILTGAQASAVAMSGDTLLISTSQGILHLNTTAPLSGALAAASDGKGDTILTTVPVAQGGGMATVAASQAGMLFYASSTGDVFSGISANLNQDQIADWGKNCSLDLTDLNPGLAKLSYSQGIGSGVLSLTDQTHSASLTLTGSFSRNEFTLAADGHGGTVIGYL
jgi:hypothetical protein